MAAPNPPLEATLLDLQTKLNALAEEETAFRDRMFVKLGDIRTIVEALGAHVKQAAANAFTAGEPDLYNKLRLIDKDLTDAVVSLEGGLAGSAARNIRDALRELERLKDERRRAAEAAA